MRIILYPTRGGQKSYPNQDAVIALAKKWKAKLIFLYISNVHFLEKLGPVRHTKVVQNELEDMGEFLLAMACERAKKAGWKAQTIVRHGSFMEIVHNVISEHQIDTLIIGAPGSTHAATTTDFLQSLIQEIQEAHQIEVLVVQDGDIIDP
ncbi:MAG: universal stress protein [Anaerolineales bacterium]|nr:universal stress protein [Anaerolineae bacterium]MBL6982585.1 universal stress protein [Anaerolineales bacterium]